MKTELLGHCCKFLDLCGTHCHVVSLSSQSTSTTPNISLPFLPSHLYLYFTVWTHTYHSITISLVFHFAPLISSFASKDEQLPNKSIWNPTASMKIWCCVIIFFNKVFFEVVLDPSALFFSFFFSSPISFLNFVLFLSLFHYFFFQDLWFFLWVFLVLSMGLFVLVFVGFIWVGMVFSGDFKFLIWFMGVEFGLKMWLWGLDFWDVVMGVGFGFVIGYGGFGSEM